MSKSEQLNEAATLTSTVASITSPNSSEEIWEVLERLNEQRALANIPAMIWVASLMVVGVFGNSLVVYVYRRRFKKTSSNYFILTLAIFDLIACLIGMPTELYDLNSPYTFFSSPGCKILRGCETFTVYGSAIVLVEIAFDRYFKICRPLMIVSLSRIRMLCALAVILAVLLSVPPLILYGINRIETPEPGIYGYDCSIAERHKNSTFQTVFYITLAAIFVLLLVTLSGLYTRLWLEIRCRRRLVIGDQIAKDPDSDSDQRRRLQIKYVPSLSEDESLNNSVCAHMHSVSMTELHINCNNKSITTQTSTTSTSERRPKMSSLASYASSLKVTRTTVVLFAVTVAFVLSYLPSIAVMLVRSTVKDIDKNQSVGTQVIMKILSNCFFINNSINPIIYSFLNVHFRRQAKKTVQRIFCCIRRKRSPPQKMDSDRSTKKEFLT